MEETSLEELQRRLQSMVQSAPSYMKEISRFSDMVMKLPIKSMYYLILKMHSLLSDRTKPMRQKLLLLRLQKDLALLSNHAFYVLSCCKILPWLIDLYKEIENNHHNGSRVQEYLSQKLTDQPDSVESKNLSKSIRQLLEEYIKWNGTIIQKHPFYKIPFSSVYCVLLGCFENINKSLKITDLTFYKTEDIKNYENNYLQEELQQQNWELREGEFLEEVINNYLSLPEDEPDKLTCLEVLQGCIETGDSLMIRKMVQICRELIRSEITGYQTIMLIDALQKVKELEFMALIRNELLSAITFYFMMMAKEEYSHIERISLGELASFIYGWKVDSEALGMKVAVYEEFFQKLKNEWIILKDEEYLQLYRSRIAKPGHSYTYRLNVVQVINREKRGSLNLRDSFDAIEEIKHLTYNRKKDAFNNQSQNSIGNRSFKQNQRSENDSKAKMQKENYLLENQPRGSAVYGGNADSVQNSQTKSNDFIEFNNSLPENSGSRPSLQKKSSGEEFIRFDNSLGENSIAFKSSGSKKMIQNNIYTSKQQNPHQKDNKSRKFSSSAKSNKSSRKSQSKSSVLKRSGSKGEKASTLRFGQVATSSRLIEAEHQHLSDRQETSQRQLKKSPNARHFDDSLNSVSSPIKKITRMSGHQSSLNKPNLNEQPHKFDSLMSSINKPSDVTNIKICKSQDRIPVSKSIKKPKFAFFSPSKAASNQIENQSADLKNKRKNLYTQLLLQVQRQCKTLSPGISIQKSDKLEKYSDIPSKFGEVLKGNSSVNQDSQISGVVINTYQKKVLQLQRQIEKTENQQRVFQKKMNKRDMKVEQLKSKLPQGNQFLYSQNQILKRRLQNLQKGKAELQEKRQLHSKVSVERRNNKAFKIINFPSSKIFGLSFTPYSEQFSRQLISNRCQLLKNQYLEVGYSLSQKEFKGSNKKELALYFKFKIDCQKVQIDLSRNSLVLKDNIQTTLYNVVETKQIKLKAEVLGYKIQKKLFNTPLLFINVRPDKKALQKVQRELKVQSKVCKFKENFDIIVPCCLFNLIEFGNPSKDPEKVLPKYSTEAFPSSKNFEQSAEEEYLLNAFKYGVWRREKGCLGAFHISYSGHLKHENFASLNKNQKGKEGQVFFENLLQYEKVKINLIIRRIESGWFTIESQNHYQEDKPVLEEIAKILSRA